MKRALLLFGVLACGSKPAAASPVQSAFVCESGSDRVVYDLKSATYYSGDRFVGAAECGGTRMAVYDMACTENPAFRFFFARGTAARLDAGGKTTLLTCK